MKLVLYKFAYGQGGLMIVDCISFQSTINNPIALLPFCAIRVFKRFKNVFIVT
jgi:hypothetical protein